MRPVTQLHRPTSRFERQQKLSDRLSVSLNWLQVSSFAKLPEIDEREGDQFEAAMTFLLGLKP